MIIPFLFLATAFAQDISVKFVKNYDGDTITVRLPQQDIPEVFNPISVRVYGIDTAEMHSTDLCGKQAAQAAKEVTYKMLSQAKEVTLQSVHRDKYFRLLAVVLADGKSLADTLLADRLAVPYFGKKKEVVNWCSERKDALGAFPGVVK